MLFVVFKLVSVVLDPGTFLVLLGLAGCLAWRLRRSVRRLLIGLSIGGLTVIAILPLGQWLLLPLEQRFPLLSHPPETVAGIILLGSAQELDISEAVGVPSFNGNMETITTFMALARRYPQATLAFSGGSGTIAGHHLSEADVTRGLFEQLGFDRAVIYESTSRDTYENAVLLKKIVQPASGSTWLLVTAANHMPRSVGCFRAAGWPVLAWPAAFKAVASLPVQFHEMGLSYHVGDLVTALHEWQGLLVYWLMGRTDRLFPAP
jgi:uncharacterized SAM-binding protein YcdF (DUF218 family)